MGIVNFLDRQLVRFANHRVARMAKDWVACNEDGGEWRLGLCTQKEAEKRILENQKNKIIYIDVDLAFIFYK